MSPVTRTHCCALFLSSAALVVLVGTSLRCASHAPVVAGVPKSSTAPSSARVYGGKLVVGHEVGPVGRDAAQAMALHLGHATGTQFDVGDSSGPGIQLRLATSPGVPPELTQKLQSLGPEAYAVRARGDGQLWIVANADAGLAFGVYQTLERWGFRFYLPNPHWTITPKLTNIEQPVEALVRPEFRKRRFAGTGGLGKGLVVDPEGKLEARWRAWMVANGFGEEFHTAGHAGEAFNVRNKQTLLEHPEYSATVNGKRVAWSKSAKLDPSNPDAVALFVRDRVEGYEEQLRRDPSGPNSFAVSVEPADGGGHCDSAACQRIGGPSEQEFFLANAVARELAKRFPGAQASIYAYNKHADVPNLAIEPNVYVTLIPYAFRGNSSVPPEDFITTWAKKKSPLSIYDYWSIPDWTSDLPEFDYRTTPAKKLRFWHEHAVEGFVAETTYSAGAMGLGWYIAGHLMWDLSRDPNALADEFYRDAFGVAAPPMKRMLERWASGFMLTGAELHDSFADLADAFRRAAAPEVVERLSDVAGYLEYLRLRHEYLDADSADEPARKRALALHLWRIYDSAMVDTFRLQKLLLRGDLELTAELDPVHAGQDVWRTLAPWTLADSRTAVTQGLKLAPPSEVELKRYAGTLTACEASPDSAARAGLEKAAPLTLVGANRLELAVPAGTREVRLELSSTLEAQVRLLDGAQRELMTTELPAGSTAATFAAEVSAPGTYWLDVQTPKRGLVTLSTSPDLGIELQEFRIPASAPVDLYFFVPPGETRVAVYSRSKIQPADKHGFAFVDASGRQVPAELSDAGHLLAARVPEGQSGKVWTLKRAVAPNASLRLLNAPQRFALSRAALRVPASAIEMRQSSGR